MALSPLRHLLSGSLSRAGIMRSVHASMIVEAANRALPAYLPATRAKDVEAASYKDGVLHLKAKTASARFYLKGQEAELLAKLQAQFPMHPMNRILVVIARRGAPYELP